MPALSASNGGSTVSQPRSAHTSDPMLAPFLAPAFSPAAYLNKTLPTLATSSSSFTTSSNSTAPSSALSAARSAQALPLPELAATAQQHVAQLAAHAARLATTLTALTDDLLRGGGARLAYDVEVLRGEARSLTEALAPGATPGMERFWRGLVDGEAEEEEEEGRDEKEEKREEKTREKGAAKKGQEAAERDEKMQREKTKEQKKQADQRGSSDDGHIASEVPPSTASLAPAALARLRTLHRVRTRLQSVIATFNAALLFPFPPSQLSSTPAPLLTNLASTSTASSSHEAAGQAALRAIRAEIDAALASRGAKTIIDGNTGDDNGENDGGGDGDGEGDGLRRAEARVAELRALCGVWKGTGEERARARWVDGLSRLVEERRGGGNGGGGSGRR